MPYRLTPSLLLLLLLVGMATLAHTDDVTIVDCLARLPGYDLNYNGHLEESEYGVFWTALMGDDNKCGSPTGFDKLSCLLCDGSLACECGTTIAIPDSNQTAEIARLCGMFATIVEETCRVDARSESDESGQTNGSVLLAVGLVVGGLTVTLLLCVFRAQYNRRATDDKSLDGTDSDLREGTNSTGTIDMHRLDDIEQQQQQQGPHPMRQRSSLIRTIEKIRIDEDHVGPVDLDGGGSCGASSASSRSVASPMDFIFQLDESNDLESDNEDEEAPRRLQLSNLASMQSFQESAWAEFENPESDTEEDDQWDLQRGRSSSSSLDRANVRRSRSWKPLRSDNTMVALRSHSQGRRKPMGLPQFDEEEDNNKQNNKHVVLGRSRIEF